MRRVGSRAEVSAEGGERKYSPTHKCLQVKSMRELPSPYFVISGSACWHALYLLHAPPRSPHFVVPHFASASCSTQQSFPMEKSNLANLVKQVGYQWRLLVMRSACAHLFAEPTRWSVGLDMCASVGLWSASFERAPDVAHMRRLLPRAKRGRCRMSI